MERKGLNPEELMPHQPSAGSQPAKGRKKGFTAANFWLTFASALVAVQIYQYVVSQHMFDESILKRGRGISNHNDPFARMRGRRQAVNLKFEPPGMTSKAKNALEESFGDSQEREIFRLHTAIQFTCGHRGVPLGDHGHLDSRKGLTPVAQQLLVKLSEAYDKLRTNAIQFSAPRLNQHAKAPWRNFEFSCFSQVGDDGLLYRIFGILGWGNRRSVEIGYFPHEANTVNLIVSQNFSGLLMDGNTDLTVTRSWYASIDGYLDILKEDHRQSQQMRTFKTPTDMDLSMKCAPYCLETCYNLNCFKAPVTVKTPHLHKGKVTAENAGELIDNAFRPESVRGDGGLDILSIDIDGMDYFIMKGILDSGVKPRVIATEFASHLGHELALTRPYSAEFSAAADSFQYGASIMAFIKLLRRFKYRFIGCVEWNAYFVLESEITRANADSAFPEQDAFSCFYQDQTTRKSEVIRLHKALAVEWVEVEAAKPKGWDEIYSLLTKNLA